MTKIVSPPEIVERAKGAGLFAALDVLLDPDYDEPECADEAAAAAIRELREHFPHLDNPTLILICDYIAGVAYGYVERYGTLGAGPLPSVGMAYGHMIVDLTNDMLDDIIAEQQAKTDEALSALRDKLHGDSPEADAA